MNRYDAYHAYGLRMAGKSFAEIGSELGASQPEVIRAVCALQREGLDQCQSCNWRPEPGRACVWPRCLYDL